MDLPLLSAGTPTTVPWKKGVFSDVKTDTLEADTVNITTLIVDNFEAKSLTLDQVSSVPNPPINKVTLFGDTSGILNVTNNVGDTVPYFPADVSLPDEGNFDMNSNELVNVLRIVPPSDDCLFGNGATGTNQATAIGDGANGGFNQGVAVGQGSSTNALGVAVGVTAINTGNNDVAVGNSAQTHNQFDVAIGTAAVTHGGIAIGASAAASGGFAIAIGDTCVNATPHSCLIGDSGILNVRANNLACDLGSISQPFKTCWLRDAQPAVGCIFSMFGAVTLTNLTAETSLTTGNANGNPSFSANQNLGSVIRFKVGYSLTVASTATLTLRFKVDGTTVVSQVTGGAPAAAVASNCVADFVVQSTTLFSNMTISANSAASSITSASTAYNPAISNTFDLTGQWSAAATGNSITVNYIYVETLYAT